MYVSGVAERGPRRGSKRLERTGAWSPLCNEDLKIRNHESVPRAAGTGLSGRSGLHAARQARGPAWLACLGFFRLDLFGVCPF
jgi:hypothetical protein